MAKPILIVKLPTSVGEEHFFEAVEHFKKEVFTGDIKQDYHIIFVLTDRHEFEFECLNAKDLEALDFKELKSEMLKVLKENSVTNLAGL